VAGSTHNYYLFAVSSFFVLDDELTPTPTSSVFLPPLNFSICVYLLCVRCYLFGYGAFSSAVASRSACAAASCV
jgi:hypothetical protein